MDGGALVCVLIVVVLWLMLGARPGPNTWRDTQTRSGDLKQERAAGNLAFRISERTFSKCMHALITLEARCGAPTHGSAILITL